MAAMRRTMTRRVFALTGLGAAMTARMALAQPGTPASPAPAGTVLYRIDLLTESLPPAPAAIGAAGLTMAPGTVVQYPEGSSGQSVAIDHVLEGGYSFESDSDAIHIDAAGAITRVAAGDPVTVSAGETLVVLENGLAQEITVGDAETRTFAFGFFSLQRGTGETTVEGTQEQEVLGGTIVDELPEPGVTVLVVPATDTSQLSGSIGQVPVTLSTGEQWVIGILPLASGATPVA